MADNKGLVEFAKVALIGGWGYVWGTFGRMLTEDQLKQKISQYPDGVGNYEGFIRKTWMGKKTVDCVGLIKSYYWTKDGKVTYDADTDVSADGMYSKAGEKGTISTIPEIPGLCVWHKGHIGIYIGNGQVIEAKGTKYGVVQTALKGSSWTHWLKCPFIDYIETNNDDLNNKIDKVVDGMKVIDIQKFLNKVGVTSDDGKVLKEDNSRGPKTNEAIANAKEILKEILR
jgi:hypothetical protein